MADRRLRDLTEKSTAQDDDVVWQDRAGQAEARKLSVAAINARAPQGDMQTGTYDPAGKARQVAAEDELYTDGQADTRADARIAASDVEDLSNVAPGATEGEVLVSRAGTWTPEPPSGGGSGDMESATYDPAGKNRQLAAEDELYTDGQADTRADARIAASNVGALADVDPGGLEGQILMRRTGVWVPEDFPGGGGGGDMLASTYDPAGKARQLAAEDELPADTDDVPEGATNLYWTDARTDTWLAGKSTDDLLEGGNLYHTNARVDARIAAADVEALANVSAGATEGEVLVSRTGVWTPEPAATGDMQTSTYDPANVAEQLVGLQAAQTVSAKTLKGIVQETRTVDTASVSGAVNIDTETANVFVRTMTGDTTFAFINPPATDFGEFVLDLNGAFTPTLPASVVWDGGNAPTFSGGRDVLAFFTHDAGTTWVGIAIALGVS